MNPMITTNQKPIIGTLKVRRKEHKHTTKDNHKTTREETEKEDMTRGELQKQPGKNNKIAMSTHLSIITLHVTGKCANQQT